MISGFAPVLSSLTLDNHKIVAKWISTRLSPEKVKLFDTNLETHDNVINFHAQRKSTKN